ncbi:MAG: A/G-specific adenine glycosylase [Anaerolineae bacterium]|jgi:A/G-specific adenine glycosylase
MDLSTVDPPETGTRAELAGRLLAWFAANARDLPWRHGRTPYRIWVSEVMLQQTQVNTVMPYYRRFMDRFPTIEALSAASLEHVLKVWEGMGYYARARHLHQAARHLVSSKEGRLPQSFDELRELPGVGAYTAGAIASLAFGQRVAAVDGNAQRVLCRVFAIREDVTRSATKHRLERVATALLPIEEPGDFNEALIELGATVCTPREPSCDCCPLSSLCQAYAQGEQELLPVRRPRRQVPHYDVTAAVTVCDDGAVLVAQRNADDMLGGLWEFPGGKCEEGEALRACLTREMREELGVEVEVGDQLIVVEHAYTHFRITLHAFQCRLRRGQPRCIDCAAFRWVLPGDLDHLPMSVVDRRIAQILIDVSEETNPVEV